MTVPFVREIHWSESIHRVRVLSGFHLLDAHLGQLDRGGQAIALGDDGEPEIGVGGQTAAGLEAQRGPDSDDAHREESDRDRDLGKTEPCFPEKCAE